MAFSRARWPLEDCGSLTHARVRDPSLRSCRAGGSLCHYVTSGGRSLQKRFDAFHGGGGVVVFTIAQCCTSLRARACMSLWVATFILHLARRGILGLHEVCTQD